ncbi:rna-directed dna polymerase from mobile element jockey- hypothetical protein [Limosa lapponica baueri]|uniref:Reverse transcriptase domain-containing protein n=1 Tax=Limosa lapponica baueri TaxID=1758121 RepID=A0A2I0TUX0_LIMLA|nr:rna-directed dna polymerase from mobile element jockey- hypothetical protein [Limosa lapponica baueri]
MSLESGKFSTYWELANVIPVYKKGMREDPGNDRPLSIIPVPGKVMEKIILGAIERPRKRKGKKEDLGNYRIASLIAVPVKLMGQLILEIISRHMEDKNMIRSSQHGFVKRK